MAYMTQKGYDELVAKLQHMESIDRPAASAAIAEARDKGDLSENAEYDAAKEHQSKLETEIAMLKKTIIEAKIIDTTHLDTSTVQILSTVELRNVKNKMTMKYTIVSATEADLRSGKISIRQAYQNMSSCIRGFIFEATGIPVEKYTLSEIRKVNIPALTQLVEEYYEPEFARFTYADVNQSIYKTRKVLELWH